MNEPVFDKFEDKPIIILNPDTQYPFKFGVYKAKKIIESFARIKAHFKLHYNKEAMANAGKNNVKPELFILELGGDIQPMKFGYHSCAAIIEYKDAIESFIRQNS